MKVLKNKRGQSLVEYMIIVALMAVATMGIVRVLSRTTSTNLARITRSLQGESSGVDMDHERVETGHFRKKDMSDFFQGSRSTSNNRRNRR